MSLAAWERERARLELYSLLDEAERDVLADDPADAPQHRRDAPRDAAARRWRERRRRRGAAGGARLLRVALGALVVVLPDRRARLRAVGHGVAIEERGADAVGARLVRRRR